MFIVFMAFMVVVSCCVHVLKEHLDDAKFRRRMLEQEAFREARRKEAKAHLDETIAFIRSAKAERTTTASVPPKEQQKVVPADLPPIQKHLVGDISSFHWNDAPQPARSSLDEELWLIAQVEDFED